MRGKAVTFRPHTELRFFAHPPARTQEFSTLWNSMGWPSTKTGKFTELKILTPSYTFADLQKFTAGRDEFLARFRDSLGSDLPSRGSRARESPILSKCWTCLKTVDPSSAFAPLLLVLRRVGPKGSFGPDLEPHFRRALWSG